MCQHLFLRPVLKNVWSSWNILLKRWKICYKWLSMTLLDPLPISSPGIWMCSRLYGPSKVIKCSVDVLHSVWCFQSPFEFLKSGLVQTILSILNRNLFNCSFLIQFQFNAVFIFLTDCSVWPSWPYTDSEDPGTGLACSQLAFILTETSCFFLYETQQCCKLCIGTTVKEWKSRGSSVLACGVDHGALLMKLRLGH